MTTKQTIAEDVKGAGRFVGHTLALIVGLLLLVVAMAMGVTVVLLPGALFVGLAGFMLIVCAVYTKPETELTRPPRR